MLYLLGSSIFLINWRFCFMSDLINEYKNFLDNGKTERECISLIISQAEHAGYKNLETLEKVSAGDKVYYSKMNKGNQRFQKI